MRTPPPPSRRAVVFLALPLTLLLVALLTGASALRSQHGRAAAARTGS